VTLDGIVWVLSCGFACRGGEPCVGAAFALARKREVPASLLARPSAAEARVTLRALFERGPRLGPATVRRCLPREFYDLAVGLGVDEWRRGASPAGEIAACGLSLGMPACAVTPYRGAARRLGAPTGRPRGSAPPATRAW
jgi:hypothetical protein